jgi:hypothetical protein
MHFGPLKIQSIASLPYKKFRTKFPQFNQNHSYDKLKILLAYKGLECIK